LDTFPDHKRGESPPCNAGTCPELTPRSDQVGQSLAGLVAADLAEMATGPAFKPVELQSGKPR